MGTLILVVMLIAGAATALGMLFGRGQEWDDLRFVWTRGLWRTKTQRRGGKVQGADLEGDD